MPPGGELCTSVVDLTVLFFLESDGEGSLKDKLMVLGDLGGGVNFWFDRETSGCSGFGVGLEWTDFTGCEVTTGWSPSNALFTSPIIGDGLFLIGDGVLVLPSTVL
jgi:hypothetical protein